MTMHQRALVLAANSQQSLPEGKDKYKWWNINRTKLKNYLDAERLRIQEHYFLWHRTTLSVANNGFEGSPEP